MGLCLAVKQKEKMNEFVTELLNRYGQRIVTELVRDIQTKQVTKYGAVNASGNLAKSIRYEVKGGTLLVYGNDYIFYLVYGRKPGKAPPRDVIVQWIKDKPIRSDIPINSLAYLIQRKIAKQGTLIYEQGGSTLLSGVVNQQLISDLSSDLFTAALDESLTYIKSNILPKIAA